MSTNDQTQPDLLLINAFEHAAIGMALVSPLGQFLRINRAISEILGYTVEELRNLTFQELTFPEDLSLDLQFFDQMNQGFISNYQMEKRYVRKNGQIIWAHLTVSASRKPSGEIDFFISQVKDISTRKELEVNLRLALGERDQLISRLEASLQQNARLRDQLVTVCAWTHRVFHDGRWMSTDEFLASYLGLNLTHGISEEGRQIFFAEERESKGEAASIRDEAYIPGLK